MTQGTFSYTDHLQHFTLLTFGAHHTGGTDQTSSQFSVERQIALLVIGNFISLKTIQLNCHTTLYAKGDCFTLSPGECLTFAKTQLSGDRSFLSKCHSIHHLIHVISVF